MKKYIYLFSCLFLILFTACRNDESFSSGTDADILLYITTQVPGTGRTNTKAVAENALSSVEVLVFEDTGSGYTYSYQVSGYSITAGAAETLYDFYARLVYSANPVKLYLVANVAAANGLIVEGATETEVRQALTGTFTSAGFDGALPMFGEVELMQGLTDDTEVDAVLVRSVARADVQNSASDFTLATVQMYRVSNQYQIIPDAMTGNVVSVASIPTGTTQTVNTQQLYVTGEQSTRQLYLPESPLPAVSGQQNATVVVIGGVYGTDTDTTYYRLDFVPNDSPALFGQVLRNHLYQFSITNVLASGWSTPDEAAAYQSSQIEVEIKAWEESTVYMVFDEVYYFGVSSRSITLAAPAGSEQSIEVDTNLDTYNLYWADANGVIDDSINPITWGESFQDSNNLYLVSISANGTQITAQANGTASDTRYLVAVGGRLRVLLTIGQGVSSLNNRPLNVYGRRAEIGSLGDYVFSTTAPGDRARGMNYIMRNTDNFGLSGTIPIERINIAGQDVTAISEQLMSIFDVLYLSYPYNPDATYTQRILNWHSANNRRVLFIHYDNAVTNNILLNTLQITRTFTNTSITPYTVYPDAPLQIIQGPFGAVDINMQYRCYDTTHGEIPLDFALANGISPILIGGGGGVSLGIDFTNRIVYSGDIDLYYPVAGGGAGQYVNATGDVTNDAGRIIANLWAWIATTVLTE